MGRLMNGLQFFLTPVCILLVYGLLDQIDKLDYQIRLDQIAGLLYQNCRIMLMDCQIRLMDYQISLIECWIRLVDCQIRLLDCQIRLMECQIRLVDCQIRLLDCQIRLLSQIRLMETVQSNFFKTLVCDGCFLSKLNESFGYRNYTKEIQNLGKHNTQQKKN